MPAAPSSASASGAKRKAGTQNVAGPKAAKTQKSRFTYRATSKQGPKKGKAKKTRRTRAQAVSLYSPFGKETPPPSATSQGNFVCVNDATRCQFTIPATNNSRILIFAPSIRGLVQIGLWDASSGGRTVGPVGIDNSSSPLFKHATNVPMAARPMRAGLRLRNLTSATEREGSVVVLNAGSPTTLLWAGATSENLSAVAVSELATAVMANPHSKLYTAEELSHGENTFVCFPATSANYNSYGSKGFSTLTTPAGIQTNWADAAHDQPMSTLIMYFPAVDKAQVYSLTLAQQTAMRFQENTIMAGMQKTATSTADQQDVSMDHGHVTANGAQTLRQVDMHGHVG